MNAIRAFLAIGALAAAAVTIAPSSAFELANLQTRSVSASIVGDGSAYTSPVLASCTGSRLSQFDCTFTITNLGTTPEKFTVTKESDPDGLILTYAVTGQTQGTGASTTASDIAVGASTTLTGKTMTCFPTCSLGTHHIYWTIDGAKANVLDSKQTTFDLTLTFST